MFNKYKNLYNELIKKYNNLVTKYKNLKSKYDILIEKNEDYENELNNKINEIIKLKKILEDSNNSNDYKIDMMNDKLKNLEYSFLEKEELLIKKYKEKESYLKILYNEQQKEYDLLLSKFKEDTIKLEELNKEIKSKNSEIINLNESIMFQDNGMYIPIYNSYNSIKYKNEIDLIRDKQKTMIAMKKAVVCDTNWIVNNSEIEGKKMINNSIKLTLRIFNLYCDSLINKVKFNNINMIEKRIVDEFNRINKLNKTNNIYINEEYLTLKIEELKLCYEYECKKQEEKEDLIQKRLLLKEQEKLEKEIRIEQERIEKEEIHCQKELKATLKKLTIVKDKDKEKLLEKIKLLEIEINTLKVSKTNVFERKDNIRAGFVYVISNKGSFGENIYKIGVTRRLEPMERVKELGTASVPFPFDVHTFIFSTDAPKLEKELHDHFSDYRVNKVNLRKEFFEIPLEKIDEFVNKTYNDKIEFKYDVMSEEYEKTLSIKKS